MNIPSAIEWANFDDVVSGDGVVTVSDELVSISSGIGSGTGRLQKNLRLVPGETIEFTCMARRVSGADATSGGLSIDWPALGTNKNRVRVVSADWQEYTIRFSCPINAAADDYAALTLGVFTADGGECEFAYPRISVTGSPFGAARMYACGLVTMTAGVPTLNSTFVQFGILGLSYNAGTTTLTVTLKPGSDSAAGSNPIFFAQMTTDAGSGALDLAPRVGQFTRTTGTLLVQFVDTTTGSLADVTTYGTFNFSLMAVF